MINRDVFNRIVDVVNNKFKEDHNNIMPEVMSYDPQLDGSFGFERICNLSIRRKAIVINYDALIAKYPYMDEESIEVMLIDRIDRFANLFIDNNSD